jgi:hypothetical protein
MTIIVYNDFLYNMDMGFDRSVKCHQNGDFALSVQGDIQLTGSVTQAILQKIWMWMSTKHGEVPGDPDIGCCIYSYYFRKAIPNTFALLQREVEFELKSQIPELMIKSVKCKGSTNSEGRVDGVNLEILSYDYGKIDLRTTKGDMEALNEAQASMYAALDFIKINNQ